MNGHSRKFIRQKPPPSTILRKNILESPSGFGQMCGITGSKKSAAYLRAGALYQSVGARADTRIHFTLSRSFDF
jgi:hypothetical protein